MNAGDSWKAARTRVAGKTTSGKGKPNQNHRAAIHQLLKGCWNPKIDLLFRRISRENLKLWLQVGWGGWKLHTSTPENSHPSTFPKIQKQNSFVRETATWELSNLVVKESRVVLTNLKLLTKNPRLLRAVSGNSSLFAEELWRRSEGSSVSRSASLPLRMQLYRQHKVSGCWYFTEMQSLTLANVIYISIFIT